MDNISNNKMDTQSRSLNMTDGEREEFTPHATIDYLLEILRATGKKYNTEKIIKAYEYAQNLSSPFRR